MAASESFDIALKESISNVREGFDGVDNLSYKQTSGVRFYSTQLSFYHIQLLH